jgi:ferredoxin
MNVVIVDETRCTGHGRCYELAPAWFEPDEFGHSRVITPVADGSADLSALRMAARSCPENAIDVDDRGGAED